VSEVSEWQRFWLGVLLGVLGVAVITLAQTEWRWPWWTCTLGVVLGFLLGAGGLRLLPPVGPFK
jgi:hypothetical protein